MKKWLLVGVLFVGLGVALILRVNPRNKSYAPVEHAPVAAVSAHSPQTIVATDDRVALQIAALNSEISALRAQVAQAAPQPAPQPNDGEARPQSPEQARQAWRDHMEQVAVEYDLEARDARWARETEAKIQGLLTTSRAVGDAVESLDCRSTSCRVRLKPSQATNYEDDLLRVVHEIGAFLPDTQFDAADPARGKRSTVLYLKKSSQEVAL